MSETAPTLWSELNEYEQCVLTVASSGDGSTLPGLLSGWDHWWQPDDLPAYTRNLAAAVIRLVALDLVAVFRGMLRDDPELSSEAIELATADPRNWDYRVHLMDDDLPDAFMFAWVSTTPSGDRVLSQTRPADVMKYFDRRHSDRERRNAPLDHG